MPPRFVILHHKLQDSEHWDLMLEHGDILLTWRLPRHLTGADCLPMEAIRIANHRNAYLTYEGPISRDRGSVQRVETGQVEIIASTEILCQFRLIGTAIAGDYLLKKHDKESWTLRRA